MDRWHYSYAGLEVASDLEIPEWTGFKRLDASDGPDVVIRLEHGTPDWAVPKSASPVIGAEEFYFCLPEVAAYQVRQGREIRVAPAACTDERELRLFLLGTAWGALCYQRNLLVLHASAVQVDEGVVVFCAAPGRGKSTLAAWLVRSGYRLVSDDLARFETPPSGQALIHPSVPRLKLWQDALDALAWSNANLERDFSRHDKFHLPLETAGQFDPLPLRAIYLLEWGDWELCRCTGQSALRRMVAAATYRGALLERMGKTGPYWQQCLELVHRVPVWSLRRPRSLAVMDEVIQRLQEHWKENA